MPVDFTAGSSGDNSDPTTTESGMFAPTPTWERTKKRRFGGRAAPERRSFFSDTPEEAAITGAGAGAATGAMAADAQATDMRSADMGPTTMTTGETAFAGTPSYAQRTTVRKRGSVAPVAIGAGLIVLAGVAAAGWYASQPHDQGVAQLTPGAPGAPVDTGGPVVAQNDTASASATAPAGPMPAAPPARTVSRTTTTHMAAAAPAPIRHRTVTRSVEDQGVNASATVAAPAPRPAPAPIPQAAPVNPAPAPTQAAPVNPTAPADQPAPTQAAPTQPSTPPQTTSPTPAPDQPPPQ
ncbi:MAG: hypothetical protein ACJ798_18535 [Phenylobacterium sp.]